MSFTYDELISRRADDVHFSYTDTQMLLYNLSVGMGRDPGNEKELPFVYETPQLSVVPTAAAVLGGGGCGGPQKSTAVPHRVPDRIPDFVHVSETRRDQALLYRLNGDRNPLHVDPAFAGKAGFPSPILHGLCSYGIACRAVMVSVCDYDPGRIRRFDLRFTSPVYPGETIHTDIWVDDNLVSLRCRVQERDIVLINNGRCEISA